MKPVLANLKAVHVLRTVPGQLVHASASPLHAWQTTRSPSRCTRRADVAARAFPFLSKLFGVKEEVKEGPQLVRIDYEAEGGVGGTSDALFGPLAVLLIGFRQLEVEHFRSFMLEMDADMVRLICCNRAMLRNTLQDALEVAAVPEYESLVPGTRRAVILSGMSSAEVLEVIEAYRDEGLPATLWAVAVPMNYERPVRDLLEDIAGDHEYMMQQRQQQI